MEYQKPNVMSFDAEKVEKEVEMGKKVSNPPPSAWSCVRG